MTESLSENPTTPADVRRLGGWAVGRSEGEDFAVGRRCRHQLADLSDGHVDADGCLVCPWHGARYDVTDGVMVEGPRGLFGYHGHIPGYDMLVRAYARFLPLAVGRVLRRGGRITVE
ncbi:Rieske-like 2Fe-2S protein [Pseudonocardia sediminis]|uniref:Rieske-like 2Fe-2S protein n=1 Tax=Pseudonocardia sediminis TaxID=1397368 RepID=A0A4Q7UQD2_PSEST|nr:Rieske 2Fe-2S domain-containing protein [Pseudonocardia sediminis]RZT83835.1 Rieske-like 2Fe-2S protein [Pseudonocardia sediminis]